MSDDPTLRGPGPDPEDGADDRDERLAALLAVAPLEDHTRTRLVRRALDAAPARRRRPALLLSAAALLVIVVTGAAILATSGGGRQTSRAAGRAARPTPVAGPPAGIPGPASAAQVAPRDLGAVGDVTNATRLRHVVAGPTSAPGRSLDSIRPVCGPVGPGGAAAGVTRIDTVGTAVDGAQPAAILVGRDGAGRRVAVVVALHDCSVLQRLPLG